MSPKHRWITTVQLVREERRLSSKAYRNHSGPFGFDTAVNFLSLLNRHSLHRFGELYRLINRLIAIGIGITALLHCTLTASAQSTEPTFTWTIPERFGLDADDDGLIDYFTTPESISPESWTVDVDGCANQSDEPIARFRWTIPGLADVEAGDCSSSLDVPALGKYEVTLTLIAESGSETSTTQTIAVRDWLVVSLGDSYASGEGVPDDDFLPFGPVKWQDAEYHRSANAGPAVAARLLEESDPQSSVTFVHLARSNAHLLHDDPDRADLNIATQIDQAVPLLGERQIDALLLSIGGNDAGFARLIKTCMALNPCYDAEFELIEGGLASALCEPVLGWTGVLARFKEICLEQAVDVDEEIREFTANWTKNAAEIFAERTEPLPDRYDELANELKVLNIREESIYIVEYANPTRQDSGAFCPQSNRANNLPGFSEDEFEWSEENLLIDLNALVEDAATRHGWTYIGGIARGFDEHGYCANGNWIVRIPQSLRTQLDLSGTLHPTAEGYAFTGEKIFEQLTATQRKSARSLFLPLTLSGATVR